LEKQLINKILEKHEFAKNFEFLKNKAKTLLIWLTSFFFKNIN